MLRGLFAPRETRAITVQDMWGPWYNHGYSVAGQSVNETTAAQLLAVYGSVQLITDSISTLPVDCFRKTPDGREPIPTPRWIQYPTADLNFVDWCGQILWSLLLHGNAYVWVMEGSTSRELVVLDPTQVHPRREAGRLSYWYKGTRIDALVLHIKGIMRPGEDVGLSPIQAAQQSIGLGLAAQQFGAEFFQGEGNMPGVIENDRPAQSADKLTQIATQWRQRRRSGGRGLPGVLDDGWKFKPTGVTNEQAQFLATRQFTAAEIAGQMFLVDPSELGIPVQGTALTYENNQSRKERLVRTTLMHWIVRIEEALSTLLASPRYVKLNVDAFLRGDTKERYETYTIGKDGGWLTVPEIREFEDMPPLPDQPQPVPAASDAVEAPVVPVEPRSADDVNFHLHLPESMRMDIPAPIVNVAVPEQAPPTVHVEAPVVNVEAPDVRVEGAQITVPVPLVNIEAPRPTQRRVQRDDMGRIVGVVEEEIK